jgi:hypothetical protein
VENDTTMILLREGIIDPRGGIIDPRGGILDPRGGIIDPRWRPRATGWANLCETWCRDRYKKVRPIQDRRGSPLASATNNWMEVLRET